MIMKKGLRFLPALAALTLLVWGCQKENNNGIAPDSGEETVVSLVVTAEQLAPTRGAGEQTQDPTESENTIDPNAGLKVYVFKPNGVLETAKALTLKDNNDGTFTTEQLVLKSGDHYFYVFANDSRGLLTAADKKSFTTTNIATAYDTECNIASIAADKKFLIGTLWSQKTTVKPGGTEAEPVKVELQIGRLASKVNVAEFNYTVAEESGLKGKFSEGKYRMGALALNIYNVGECGESALPTTDGVLVTSCLHNAPYTTANYLLAPEVWKNAGEFFYATENTTALNANNEQLFGNTTFVQIETKYVPVANEVYDVATGGIAAEFTGGTFWTAQYENKRLIFNGDPRNNEFFPGVSDVKEYTDGLNYHEFPVYDAKEKEDVLKNRVLRNHYYEYKITKINDLGSPSKEPDPTKPIPTTSTVEVSVKVLKWSKVTSEVEVG